uniref:Uncharacterized protein n=1 Tax=Oryza glumipatula TaxID=40148 RepID=A0A0E0BIK0_9ORYZ
MRCCGVSFPADMMEAAKDAGIREVLLLRHFGLQFPFHLLGAPWPLVAMIRAFLMLRN